MKNHLQCVGGFFFCLMIDSDTPHKMAEIIRDTWPNLFRPPLKNIENDEDNSSNIDKDSNA